MSNTKFDPSNVKLDSPFSVFAVFDPVIIRLSALLLIVTVVPTLLESTQFNCDPVDVKTCPEFPSSPSLSASSACAGPAKASRRPRRVTARLPDLHVQPQTAACACSVHTAGAARSRVNRRILSPQTSRMAREHFATPGLRTGTRISCTAPRRQSLPSRLSHGQPRS